MDILKIKNVDGSWTTVPAIQGEAGKDAKINGVNILTLVEGQNITLSQAGNELTISAASESAFIIKTTASAGSTDLKSITTAEAKQYATVGERTPWGVENIPAEYFSKMIDGQLLLLLVKNSDKNKNIYLVGIAREITNNSCVVEGVGLLDGMPASQEDLTNYATKNDLNIAIGDVLKEAF